MPEMNTDFYPKQQQNSLLGTITQAAQASNLGMQNKLMGVDLQQKHVDLVNNQVSSLVNGFSSLASKPDLNVQDFSNLAQRFVNQGVISPDVSRAEMAAVVAAGNDQGALRKLATGYSLRALDAGQRFNAQYGTASLVDNGQTINPMTTSPLTGNHVIGAPIQKTLTPAESSSDAVIGVNANNQPIHGTVGQRLTELGLNPQTGGPAPAPGGNALMPAAAPAPAQGAPGNALLPDAPTPMPNAATTTLGGQRGIVTEPAPGAAEAQAAVGVGAGKQLSDDLVQATNYQQNVLPLQKAISSLEELGTTGTGPGTDQVNQMFSFLQSMHVPGIDPNGIKSYDEAKKYLTQYVNMNGNSTTNDKLAASFAGNPSTEISNAAAVDVAKTALSLSRLQNAKVRAFAASGLPESDYSKWATDFNSNQDPRAYGMDLMKPEQRAKLIQSLSGAEKTKFAGSLRTAIGLGLVTPPGATPNGQ